MMLCLSCGCQKPNWYRNHTCPQCESYLKYIAPAAKPTIIKMHKASLRISYAVADVYDYVDGVIFTTIICFGISHPYPAIVFSRLPEGYEYIFPEDDDLDFISHLPIEHIISPVRTYGLLRYEAKYLEKSEAKLALKRKLDEIDAWIDDASKDWLIVCHLGGWLD